MKLSGNAPDTNLGIHNPKLFQGTFRPFRNFSKRLFEEIENFFKGLLMIGLFSRMNANASDISSTLTNAPNGCIIGSKGDDYDDKGNAPAAWRHAA